MSGRRSTLGWSAVCVLMLLGRAGSAPAQAPDAGAALHIAPGKVVRARLDAERTLKGAYVPVGDGRLGIRRDEGPIDTLRVGEIRELAIRERHTKTGAVLGGLAGLGFGVFVGYVVTHTCDAADCDNGPYAVTIPVFTAAGLLTGAVIGTAFPKWKRVFP